MKYFGLYILFMLVFSCTPEPEFPVRYVYEQQRIENARAYSTSSGQIESIDISDELEMIFREELSRIYSEEGAPFDSLAITLIDEVNATLEYLDPSSGNIELENGTYERTMSPTRLLLNAGDLSAFEIEGDCIEIRQWGGVITSVNQDRNIRFVYLNYFAEVLSDIDFVETQSDFQPGDTLFIMDVYDRFCPE